jgi:hypothetical protein
VFNPLPDNKCTQGFDGEPVSKDNPYCQVVAVKDHQQLPQQQQLYHHAAEAGGQGGKEETSAHSQIPGTGRPEKGDLPSTILLYITVKWTR